MSINHFNDPETLAQISACYAHAIKLDAELRKKFDAECEERNEYRKRLKCKEPALTLYIDGKSVSRDEYFDRKLSIKAQFDAQFEYLATYANREGCIYDKKTGADTECRIGKDFAPLSFCFAMYCRKSAEAPWEYWFNGGLIYQGPAVSANGSVPSLTVSMDSTRIGWFVHT